MKYFIAIPTYQGGQLWKKTVASIQRYVPEGVRVQIIDSSSQDETQTVAEQAGFATLTISSQAFNHGGTRNQCVEMQHSQYDVVVFLTQDAIPEAGFVEELIAAFTDSRVACAYGRQLPHLDANPIAAHARHFNYPSQAWQGGIASVAERGLKTVFMSNSFSAYRISVFKELGGFPSDTILCEDMYYTAKAVAAGYEVAYVPEAKVRHSHNYTASEEFRRYFDIGVFHANNPWIRQQFGAATGEGKRFLLSELRYLAKHGLGYLPQAMLNNAMKFLGYKLGQWYRSLPDAMIKRCSMHRHYWQD